MCPEDFSEDSSDTTDQTSEVETSDSQTDSQEAEQQAAAPETKKDETPVPFHEHPRFKELIDERRAYKEQLDQTRGYVEAMQRELQNLRTQSTPKPATPENKYKPLIDQIRAHNPEFAAFQETLLQDLEKTQKELATAQALRQRLDQFEQRDFRNGAVSRLNQLMESNKIPEPQRKRYDREVRAMAFEEESQGKQLKLEDVDRLFKAVHDEYTPFLESIKRETLKGYVQEKRTDKTPAPATGGAAVVPGTQKLKAGDEDGLIKWVANGLRQAKKV